MIKNLKRVAALAMVAILFSFGFGESVDAASSAPVSASFSGTGKLVLADMIPTINYPYLYTISQLYDAQFSISLGNDEVSSPYQTTVVGGTFMVTSLGSMIDSYGNPVAIMRVYMKNKNTTALNRYQGTFFY